MPPEGVSGIAITVEFWQPQKKGKKSGIDQILTSACCPQQYEYIDIKRVAYNHVTAILQWCQNGQKCAVVLLLILLVTLFISMRFLMNYWRYRHNQYTSKTVTTHRCAFWVFSWYCLGMKYPQNPNFWGVNRRFQAKRAKYWKLHVIETTASILTKFGVTTETTKWLSWVVPVGAQQIQYGGRPFILTYNDRMVRIYILSGAWL